MKWLNIFKSNKDKRVFNIKFIATGFMSNKYFVAEYTEIVSDYDIEKNDISHVIFLKYYDVLSKHYKRSKNNKTTFEYILEEVTEEKED